MEIAILWEFGALYVNMCMLTAFHNVSLSGLMPLIHELCCMYQLRLGPCRVAVEMRQGPEYQISVEFYFQYPLVKMKKRDDGVLPLLITLV